MKWRLAGLAVCGLALMAAPAVAQQAHPVPHGGAPDKSDVHVAQLYALVKQVHAAGMEHVDHAAVLAQLNAIADAHAVETGADKADMEAQVMEMAHRAVMTAEANPHMLDTLDTFWVGLHAQGVLPPQAAHAAPHPAAADGATTKSLQGGDPRAWLEDPNMHAFYDLTKATLGGSPKTVDFKAYNARSMELFGKFGEAHGVGAKAMQDHLKAIPKQMVDIVKSDPHVLDSWDNFVVSLIGPQ